MMRVYNHVYKRVYVHVYVHVYGHVCETGRADGTHRCGSDAVWRALPCRNFHARRYECSKIHVMYGLFVA